MAIASNTLSSMATEEQRRDYFTLLAATATSSPEQRRTQHACTRLRTSMARARVHARLSVPGSSIILSEGGSEDGSERGSEDPL